MNISVEYKDTAGTISNQTHRITRLAFAKHFAIAGQAYAPRPQKLIRTIAMFFHYSYYLQHGAFYDDRFSEPPIQLSDPTEKGQFSNLAGRSIADFLSKRINQSLFTVNYEAEMRLRKMRIGKVGRPDLLAYTQNSCFAIEAKGYDGWFGNMTKHKNQSQTGGIPVNFTVACISYDIYNKVKCKYYDPFNENIPYDNERLSALSRNYYQGLSGFLNQNFFTYREFEYQGEIFYEVELLNRYLEKFFPDESPFRLTPYFDIFDYYRPKLILPKEIEEYAKNGLTNETKPFLNSNAEQYDTTLYIDNDRVGLRITR